MSPSSKLSKLSSPLSLYCKSHIGSCGYIVGICDENRTRKAELSSLIARALASCFPAIDGWSAYRENGEQVHQLGYQ
jgi:hypothetical protein